MNDPGVEVLIALGSNLGDRRKNLEGAVRRLREAPAVRVLAVSPWIETEPVGGPPGQPPYWNGVVRASTGLEPRELFELLAAIERDLGRVRTGVAGEPRTLDLDLLFYGERELDEPGLVVPHPRLEERAFVLEPLAALVPERRLPRCGLTVAERLAEIRL